MGNLSQDDKFLIINLKLKYLNCLQQPTQPAAFLSPDASVRAHMKEIFDQTETITKENKALKDLFDKNVPHLTFQYLGLEDKVKSAVIDNNTISRNVTVLENQIKTFGDAFNKKLSELSQELKLESSRGKQESKNFNADIDSLKVRLDKEVQNFNESKRTTALEKNFISLSQNVERLEASIFDVPANIKRLVTEVEALKSTIPTLKESI